MLLQNTNNYLLSDEVLKAIKAAAISNNLANVQRFFDVSYPGLDPNYIYLSTEDEGGDNLTSARFYIMQRRAEGMRWLPIF
jgi:hypothetical protein